MIPFVDCNEAVFRGTLILLLLAAFVGVVCFAISLSYRLKLRYILPVPGPVRGGRRSSCSGPSGCPGAGTQEKIEKQLLFFGKPCYNDAVVTRSSALLYLKFWEGILCY